MNVISRKHAGINSLFSLQPLVAALQKMVANGKPGTRKLYEHLLQELDAAPQLLQPTADTKVLADQETLLNSVLASLFPPATHEQEGIYAVSYPFHNQIVYASDPFRSIFLPGTTDRINVSGTEATESIGRSSLQLAYNLILRRFYNQQVPAVASSVHAIPDGESGLTRYLELKLNAGFVTVKLADSNFALPKNISAQRALDVEELRAMLPLEHFQFEGLVVIEVADVTGEEVIAAIKNSLLNINAAADGTVYAGFGVHVQTLIGLPSVEVGITPFFRMNDFSLFAETYFSNSLLLRNGAAADDAARYSRLAGHMFRNSDQPLLYSQFSVEKNGGGLLQAYYDLGARSLVLCPLKCDDGELIGLLELISTKPGTLRFEHLTRLQPAIQLFALALDKHAENLELQIDKTIKEHFTAIQPAVAWKFTEAAFNYLQHQQSQDSVKMQPIMFENVHPLYGAIDVRNSSLERTHSIQLDLMEQLTQASNVLEKAAQLAPFPLLREIQFKVEQYLANTSDTLLSDDELLICDFLQGDLHNLFRHLHETRPDLQKHIDAYFALLDQQRGMVYHHRKKYEDSITRINDMLDRFMDAEQKNAQQVYPHYFERYITDGIEFNIYVGQSLAPNAPFDEIYVRNLKLWQLTLLARAARLSHALEKRLPMSLQTTQLILAHSIPLSISFRRKERKFDVDGAYNIRYEIIKKRIDKVHLKDSEERLTQPGKVAIVYSQQKELNEYLEYIQFLQHEGLLGDSVEHLELEDTQGISGLKAIRVDVNFNQEPNGAKESVSQRMEVPAAQR
jgi:hypothetical protein